MNKRAKKIILFIGITFALSWTIAVLFFILGGKWGTPASMMVAMVIMFMPMVSAILVQKAIYKEPLRKPLGISFKLNRWWLAAWFFPPLFAIAAMGMSLLIPGVSYSPEMAGFFEMLEGVTTPEQLEQIREQLAAFPIHIFWILLIQGMVAGITVNAIVAFGEELGWQGFLLRELSHMKLWKASAIIGLVWGIWHAPMVLQGHNYPEHPVAGVFMMTLLCLLLAPIFSYIRIKAKSVIAAAIVHGSLNGTAGLAVIMVEGGNDLLIGVTGAAGIAVLLIANLGIFLFDRSIRGKSVSAMMDEPSLV
jgi:membrane protease YdiL (CAAX protease family)